MSQCSWLRFKKLTWLLLVWSVTFRIKERSLRRTLLVL